MIKEDEIDGIQEINQVVADISSTLNAGKKYTPKEAAMYMAGSMAAIKSCLADLQYTSNHFKTVMQQSEFIKDREKVMKLRNTVCECAAECLILAAICDKADTGL